MNYWDRWLRAAMQSRIMPFLWCNLHDANLSYANLRDADLRDADLRDANLSDANLRGANLSYANLRDADLSGANLRDANLSRANLSRANLRDANLSGANLSGANLSGADLSGANLSGANLSGADLSGANLSGANLSGSTGLLDAIAWLREQFDILRDGSVLVWTRKGGDATEFAPPKHWTIAPGETLTEVPNPDRCTVCGCGVNFGTWDWCQREYTGAPLWAACIEPLDLAGVVVPYNTDGKARCARLTLLREVRP